MNRTTHIRLTLAMGFAAQGLGSCIGGTMNVFLHQASAQAGVAATK